MGTFGSLAGTGVTTGGRDVLQATEELQQQTAAALATMTLSLRRGPRLAWQAQAWPRSLLHFSQAPKS